MQRLERHVREVVTEQMRQALRLRTLEDRLGLKHQFQERDRDRRQ